MAFPDDPDMRTTPAPATRQRCPIPMMQADGRPSPATRPDEVREPDTDEEVEPGYGHGV